MYVYTRYGYTYATQNKQSDPNIHTTPTCLHTQSAFNLKVTEKAVLSAVRKKNKRRQQMGKNDHELDTKPPTQQGSKEKAR